MFHTELSVACFGLPRGKKQGVYRSGSLQLPYVAVLIGGVASSAYPELAKLTAAEDDPSKSSSKRKDTTFPD